MPEMTEEQRRQYEDFLARQARTQADYQARIDANTPNAGEPAATEWSGLSSDYAQGPGQGTGEGYKDFASSQEFAPMPEQVVNAGDLTSPNAFDHTVAPPNDAQPYAGQAFPGVPIIQEGGRFYAGGNNGYGGQGGNAFNTEEEAMAARAQNAATDVQGQRLFQQQAQEAAQREPATEPTSIQIMAEMSQRQLSPAQRLEMTQMQNGIARLQRDAREGRVPALQAAQLEAQLQARLRPRMVSQMELQGMTQALRYTQLREQTTHLAMNNQRARAFDASHGMTDQSPVVIDGVTVGAMVRNSDGSTHWVQKPDTTTRDAHIAESERLARERLTIRSNERFDTALQNEMHRLETRRADITSPPEVRNMTDDALLALATTRAQAVHGAWSRLPGNSLPASSTATGGAATTAQGGGSSGVRGGAQAAAGAATGATSTGGGGQTPTPVWQPLNSRPAVTRPDLETRDQPSDVSDARVHLLHQRMQDLLPASDREQWNNFRVNVHNPVPSNTNDLRGQIYSVLHRASDEGRALTNDERYWYINAQRALESRNPVEGQILDVQGSPIQRSYDAPADFVAKLSTEANTLHDSFSRWNPLTTNARATVNTMRGILGTAASDNRALTPAETTRYLRYLGDLRRIDPTMADNLRLNQFRARTP